MGKPCHLWCEGAANSTNWKGKISWLIAPATYYDLLNYFSTITSSLTDLIESKETTRFPPSSK